MNSMEATSTRLRISPLAAFVCSVCVPGLGQIITGKLQKGLLFLGSFATIVGLLMWRVHLLAHREVGAWDKLVKALSRAPVFTGGALLLILFLWIWIAFDAHRQSRGRGTNMPFLLIIFLFFSFGWQISEIDLVKMAMNFSDTLNPLSKIMWPWKAAITYDTESVSASAEILADDDENPPPPPEEVSGEPYVKASPTYGRLSRVENNQMIKGDTITITGKNFEPETLTEIWWSDSIGNEFRPRQEGEYVAVTTDENGAFEFDLIMPYRLTPPSAVGQQIHQVEARQVSQVGGPKASEPLKITIELIVETIFMGMMATIFGIIFSIPISFLAARNLMAGSRLSMAVYYVTRSILNIVRAIEPLIWALVAVVWVGLGPFAGILALTIHTIAALGKLYSEAIENIDHGQIEAIQATGATKLQTIAFGVIPQMIPPFVSFTIYRWDINVRMSTVIGMVGGGGIGFVLVQYIRLLDYRAAGIAVWFIAITVSILDYVSAEIRNRFV